VTPSVTGRQGIGDSIDQGRLVRRRGRSALTLFLLGMMAMVGVVGFIALGVWQLERRVWKLDLIDQVERRIHAPASPIPAPDAWSAVNAANDAYRRVSVRGRFLHDRETLVQAVTELGRGYWVLTPLRTDEGPTFLVNRGFVPPDRHDRVTRQDGNPTGEVHVTGLLRMTEPTGGFLRANDPGAGRWYSRDVAAIAAARGLSRVAPFFVDADATPNPGGWPVGGLTVVTFRNSHMVYALTWFTMAFMLAGAAVMVAREEWRSRKESLDSGASFDANHVFTRQGSVATPDSRC